MLGREAVAIHPDGTQFVGVGGGGDGPLFVPLLNQKIGDQATLKALIDRALFFGYLARVTRVNCGGIPPPLQNSNKENAY